MKRTGIRPYSQHDRAHAGFTYIALLILIGVMASLAMTYSRHVIVLVDSTELTTSVIQAQEVIDSQIEYVLQAHAAGATVSDSVILDAVRPEAKRHLTALGVSSLADDHSRIQLSAIAPDGMGATHLVEMELAASPASRTPDTLPRLDDTLRLSVVADLSVPKIHYTTSSVVQDTELTGLVVVHDGVVLTLRNVIVHGAVVSAGALTSSPFGAFSAVLGPRVVIDGNVRIMAGSDLPGLALLMPDGALSTSNAQARLQVRGDIVAHGVQLGCPGATQGNIACVDPLVLHADQERVGSTRVPLDWSAALDHQGAWQTRFLAFVPRNYTVAELSAVTSHKPKNKDKPWNKTKKGGKKGHH